VVGNKKPNLLVGSLICGAVPIRDPHNKWYCPDYMFSRKVYPNYLSGTAYLMSRSAALTLFEAAAQVPIFHLEDIYVTGILAEQVLTISLHTGGGNVLMYPLKSQQHFGLKNAIQK
jgi:hypothetical protein